MIGGPVVACVDFGSTFTKACLVDLASATVTARAAYPTTLSTDILDGWAACRAQLVASDSRAAEAEVLACSSAGGGLRIAVVGNEELVTSEAGRRVALSSGGRVVQVMSGRLDAPALQALSASAPDVVLLVGGTDGGNSEVLLAGAAALAGAGLGVPVVVAGNCSARPAIEEILGAAGVAYVVADNVMPRIGTFTPGPARRAVREVFLTHVIGGKHLSSQEGFAAMVRGATPDVMLTAVELLARGLDDDRPGVGDVVVLDVGGATTDVYSVVETDPEVQGREVVGSVPANRTVEGDLGMRWSAPSTVEAAKREGLLDETDPDQRAVESRAGQLQAAPDTVPETAAEVDVERRLAGWATAVALRRHAGRAQVRFEHQADGSSRLVERSGIDLREVRLLVGSGGVFRHQEDAAAGARTVAASLVADGGWQLPQQPEVVLDSDYVLMPAGLLASGHPEVAHRLLQILRRPQPST